MLQKIEISYKTVVFTVIFLLSLWFLWSVRKVILQIFVAIILMTAFNPLVNRLEKTRVFSWQISRSVAILMVYLVLLAVISEFIALISQPLIGQTTSLVRQLPAVLLTLDDWGADQSVISNQLGQLTALPGDLVRTIGGVFSNVLSVFTTLVMSFYLLAERERLHKHLTNLFGNVTLEKKIEALLDRLEVGLGGWVRAEAMLMIIVGTLSYIGLLILGVPYALPLALLAGLLEAIPNIGPFFSAIPAVMIGLTVSPLVAVGVVALYLCVQLLENNLIVPQIMSKTVGVNPFVTIVVLLVGLEIAGVTGAILAVPAVLLGREVLQAFALGNWREDKS